MRVLIVAAHAAAAQNVRRMLGFTPSLTLLGWLDASRPYRTPMARDVDVIVLHDGAGMEMVLSRASELRGAHPDAKLILLAGDTSSDALAEAGANGLHAVVSTAASASVVGVLVREVAAGRVFHFGPAPRAVSDAPERQVLTNRELEMLRLVAGGLSNSRIAAQLWVTEQTVKFHLSNVYRKLGLSNRTQAAHYAFLHGLVDTTDVPPPSSIRVAA
jgi:DNA-binding NarL/FixJ family response regulator